MSTRNLEVLLAGFDLKRDPARPRKALRVWIEFL